MSGLHGVSPAHLAEIQEATRSIGRLTEATSPVLDGLSGFAETTFPMVDGLRGFAEATSPVLDGLRGLAETTSPLPSRLAVTVAVARRRIHGCLPL